MGVQTTVTKEKMMTQRITSGQIAQLSQMAESAVRKAIPEVFVSMSITQTDAQYLVEHGKDFQEYCVTIFTKALLDLFDKNVVDTEVLSKNGYLMHKGVPSIEAQLDILHTLFPQIGKANAEIVKKIQEGHIVYSDIPLRVPSEDRGVWAIPHWSKIGNSYPEALEKVLSLLEKTQGTANYLKERYGYEYIRETEQKKQAMTLLLYQQQSDIILLQTQLGIRHRGMSIYRANKSMDTHEFGLGAYEVGIILLLYPERLEKSTDLWIDCSGDEFSPIAGGPFKATPLFKMIHNLTIRARFDSANETCGAASGFVNSWK